MVSMNALGVVKGRLLSLQQWQKERCPLCGLNTGPAVVGIYRVDASDRRSPTELSRLN
jgi:hypothetical protein